MKIRSAAIFLVLISSFGIGSSSKAEEPTNPEAHGKCAIAAFSEARNGAAAIFTGKILSESKDGDTRTFVFKIEKYWKGAKKKTIKINVYETMRYQAWFEVGERYLVFATADENGKLNVVRCSRSNKIEDAAKDIAALGKGKRLGKTVWETK